MVSKVRKVWRLWCYALGAKTGKDNNEADTVAIIRTVIFASYLITNVAIVANAVRHWNDVDYTQNTPICVKNR